MTSYNAPLKRALSPLLYHIDWNYECGDDCYQLVKKTQNGDIAFTHDMHSVGDWYNLEFYPTWNGDYYTQHGTPQGLVITKYDLHVDPVCNLMVVTPRPHTGPSPVAVEFDASGTYDDDGDTLTFHWDFDGDKVFDEPIDDAYTGTPENPTHEYTADYDGPVNLRVTDNYQGECDIAVILSVDVQ